MNLPAHWWKERGAFLDALHEATAGESGGEGARKGWTWLTEHESKETAARAREALLSDASPLHAWIHEDAHATCREVIARAVPLAHRGGLLGDRWARKLHNPTLWGDPTRPEQVWLALDESTPPALWVPAGATAGSLAKAWEPYAWPELDAPLPTILSLPNAVRLFIGTEQGMEVELTQLAGFIQSLPGADSLPWGPRFADDPWPDRPTGIALIAAGYRMAENTAQLDGAVPCLTVRSRRLGAAVSLSSLEHFFVLEVKYAPVQHESILTSLSQALPGLPKGLPPDIPVDALSVLARFHGAQAADLLEAVRGPGQKEDLGFHAMAYLATVADDGGAVRALIRELCSRPEPAERSLGYHLGSIARQTRLLHEALLRETDPENRRALQDHLHP